MEPNKKNTNSEQDFPGYPHYPAADDITNKGEEILSQADNPVSEGEEEAVTAPETADAQDRDGDVTDEDVRMLSAADQNRDMDDEDLEEAKLDTTDNDGDPLNEASSTYGENGNDLDVPGSEDDDRDEAAGSEDEENNYYSLGGDNHENLEEDQSV